MRLNLPPVSCLLLALLAPIARADDAPPVAPTDLVAEAAQPAVAVVDAFSAALKAGDLAKVGALLADDVLVLEGGGAERSKAEYLDHHAGADAQFLREAHVQPLRRRAHVLGDLAWVATESEIHAARDGQPLVLLSTETMVVQRFADGWRIVHIHWSSRPKKQ